jgi:hypothetical protein
MQFPNDDIYTCKHNNSTMEWPYDSSSSIRSANAVHAALNVLDLRNLERLNLRKIVSDILLSDRSLETVEPRIMTRWNGGNTITPNFSFAFAAEVRRSFRHNSRHVP